MITFKNGLSFQVHRASGSRGWAGRDEGHGFARTWKWPFQALGCFPDIL